MNYNARILSPFYKLLSMKLERGDFVCDKIKDGTMGDKLVEIIAPQIFFDMSKAEKQGARTALGVRGRQGGKRRNGSRGA